MIDSCFIFCVAGESFKAHRDPRVVRLFQLSENWRLAEERGRLQPWRGGYGRTGDDKIRSDYYRRLAELIARKPNPSEEELAVFPTGILDELTNTTPLGEGEHASLFCDPPAICTDLAEYSVAACQAAERLLNMDANQPLLRHSSPTLQAMCTSLLDSSNLSHSELATIADGKVPVRTGIDDDKLARTLGGTYASFGYEQAETVGQFRQCVAQNSYPRLASHIQAALEFVKELPDDAPLPVQVSGYAGRLDSAMKSLAKRHEEHNTSLEASGAYRHYYMHQLCGPPTSFSSIISSEATAATYLKFSAVVSIKNLLEISEALTQSMFSCWHNEDLMGGSEVGGLLKRINKEINRQAFALRAKDAS